MRVLWVAAATAAAFTAVLTLAATPAAAGHCCRSVLYGVPQGPPSPYYLADQASPFYLVNQGPVYSGPGIVADNNIFYPSLPRPIYAVGGYAYVQGFYPPAMQYPYVRSSGGWRCRGGYGECGSFGAARPHFYRAARFAPYGAQLYRGAPSARVITLPSYGY
jgi:hypothetical protein